MKKIEVVYTAGPYRAKTASGIVANIRRAEAIAVELWRMGYAAVCPHLNTALMDGLAPDHVWLNGDLKIMERCDAVVLIEGWENSQGTLAEIEHAKARGIPVFNSPEELAWSEV
jgi:nucleoside 2-deoxyribosyltransferase